ncbi:hypothetical protein [Peribacillus frigoritolerans]|uniref:hypothetical protein n=1 Tax=Peribacillus castrilensis TaxID=2897690 RepID=UPI002DD39A22|nr:hypothetical protein [Peribacillus castrilensis]
MDLILWNVLNIPIEKFNKKCFGTIKSEILLLTKSKSSQKGGFLLCNETDENRVRVGGHD